MIGPGALLLAFGAGLGSFLLPCTLPLIPGYLSYISGLGADEMQSQGSRATLVGAASLFVLGFSLVFVALGATVSYIGSTLLPYRDVLTRVSGAFIILMALVVLGLSALGDALRMGFDMFWDVLWSLVLGFALSAIVQLFVSHRTMARLPGDDSPRSLTLVALFRIASNSWIFISATTVQKLRSTS